MTPTFSGSRTHSAGVLEVVAGERLAVRPLEAVAERPGHGHGVAAVTGRLDAAVADRRDVRGEIRRVLVVVREDDERRPHGGRDVGLGLVAEVVRVELVGFLPVADDQRAAVRAVRRGVRRAEEVVLGVGDARWRRIRRRRVARGGAFARLRRWRAAAARGGEDGGRADEGGQSVSHGDLPRAGRVRTFPGPDRRLPRVDARSEAQARWPRVRPMRIAGRAPTEQRRSGRPPGAGSGRGIAGGRATARRIRSASGAGHVVSCGHFARPGSPSGH